MGNMAADGQNTNRMMSKTQHYRKVTKPLLERKRRARMNHYLDELKDLIIETMESQGEHITKLEKADILEMTVTYLRTKNDDKLSEDLKKSQRQNNDVPMNAEKFRAGYTQAAYEVSKVFASIPGIDVHFGTKLMKHLGYKLKDLPVVVAPSPSTSTTTTNQTNENHLIGTSHQSSSELVEIQNNKINFDSDKMPPQIKIDQEERINDVWRPW